MKEYLKFMFSGKPLLVTVLYFGSIVGASYNIKFGAILILLTMGVLVTALSIDARNLERKRRNKELTIQKARAMKMLNKMMEED